MGDEVQAIKAGLLEVADIIVVNKGDRPGAQRTAAQLRAMLVPTVARKDADPTRPAPKRPEVLVTTALTGEGVPALLAALEKHRAAGGDGASSPSRRARATAQVRAVARRAAVGSTHHGRSGDGHRGRDRRRGRPRARPVRRRGPAARGLARGPMTLGRHAHATRHPIVRPAPGDRAGVLHGRRHGAPGVVAVRGPGPRCRRGRRRRGRRGVRARLARHAAGRRVGVGSLRPPAVAGGRGPAHGRGAAPAPRRVDAPGVRRGAGRVRSRRGVLLRRVPGHRQRPRAARPPRRGAQPRDVGAVPGSRVRAAAGRDRAERRRLHGRLDRGSHTRRRGGRPRACWSPRPRRP